MNEDSILEAVRRAGLEAETIDDTCLSGVCAVEEHWWKKQGRSILCWSSGALVLMGFLTYAVLHGNLLHALVGAMIIGQWFEAGTVTFLFALSLLLESWSVRRARRAIRALVNMTPPTARLKRQILPSCLMTWLVFLG
jgi:hypothetical protein